jgi:hypothetical protein
MFPARRLALILVVASIPGAAARQGARVDDPLVVVRDGKYGYIDHDGTIVIRPAFLWGSDFINGYATVYICGRTVSIDRNGQLIPLRHSTRNDGLSPQRVGDKTGFVDIDGRLKISATFDEALPFSDGLAAVQVGRSWGFVDANGQLAIPAVFDAAFYFREGVGFAKQGDDDVLIDKSGKILARGLRAGGFSTEGRVSVARNDVFGYVDTRGRVVIPFAYEQAEMFVHGLAAVEKGGTWGYVDRDGTIAIPFAFDRAGPFFSGLAPVIRGDESGFIDRTGTFAFHVPFASAPGFSTANADGMALTDTDVSRFFTADGGFGYVNTAGKIIWGSVHESPDHPPPFGWTEAQKIASCDGVSVEERGRIAAFRE